MTLTQIYWHKLHGAAAIYFLDTDAFQIEIIKRRKEKKETVKVNNLQYTSEIKISLNTMLEEKRSCKVEKMWSMLYLIKH